MGTITPHPGGPAMGLTGDAVLRPSALIRNDGTTPSSVQVNFTLVSADGGVAASALTPALVVPPNSTATATLPSAVTVRGAEGCTNCTAELWSVARPYLYTLVTSVLSNGVVIDSVVSSVGIRAAQWDADTGLYINAQPVKLRGFCNHESFGGIGAAIPARVDLLRVQQMRGLGGNGWRTSHNAPEPHLLDLTDRLGVVVMDENRVFQTTKSCPGCPNVPSYNGDVVRDMSDLVSRDKLHTSVLWWSACNEAGCGDGRAEPAVSFRKAIYELDGSRAFGANMGWLSPMSVTPMSDVLDVMGFSHADASTVAKFHADDPTKPLVMSECCSCETQRSEDADQPWNKTTVFYGSETSGCLSGETQRSNAVVYNSGTFIWTLHDYLGEPDRWPHVSSSFGSIDVAGFPKAASFWLRSWWLSHIAAADAGRPPLPAPAAATTVYLVESWAPHGTGANTRSLHAYSNAPYVRLLVNGAVLGSSQKMTDFGMVTWNNVPYVAGNATVEALDGPSGTVLATFSRKSWGAAAAIVLSCDAPTPTTGTGDAVYLDGTDVALLRATVVDAAGVTVANSVANITFTVTAGPGLLLGTVNGDPANHDPNAAPWKPAYHGLVRAIVRANLVAVGDRALLSQVNLEAGKSASAATILSPGQAPPTSMTISATSPGIPTAFITIQLSTDPKDEVLAVAAASVGSASMGE